MFYNFKELKKIAGLIVGLGKRCPQKLQKYEVIFECEYLG